MALPLVRLRHLQRQARPASGSCSTSAPPPPSRRSSSSCRAAQDVTVYATDSGSTKSLDGAQKIGSATNANGTVVIKATGQLKPASKIIVLVTKAAPAEAANHYRAQISEVTVR